MRIAIFDIGWKELHGPDPLSEPLGGSETWLTQISREFVRQGHAVDVFCFTKEAFISQKNLTYWPKEKFYKFKTKYDFIILNRVFLDRGRSLVNYIREHNLANHVYLQIHDLSLQIGGTLVGKDYDFDKAGMTDPDFFTVVTLNEWHRSNFNWQYPTITPSRICIPNGVDLSLFKDNGNKRDNRVLWSSCIDRGIDIFINKVYPLVKAKIPDFGIDVARYNDDHQIIGIEDKDVKMIGKLSKEELYNEQSKHKLWFYPGTFAETFCITMIENIMNGAQVVSPFTYGMGPVLANMTNGHPEVVQMKNKFGEFKSTEISQEAVEEAANKIVEILSKPYKHPQIYKDMQNVIRRDYNWKHSVDLYLEHYNSLEKKEIKSKKLLILSMNCNSPYFKSLLGAIKDTWAKPIIQGKYADIEWFAYTACDSKHPKPCIDFKDHMIYVDSGDGLYDTYEKTQKAYKLIVSSGIKFDYVVRTNTSVFLNLRKLVEKIDSTEDDAILGGVVGYYHVYPDGRSEFKFNIVPGLFMGMSKTNFDIAMSSTSNYDTIPSPDDVIMSGALNDKFGKLKVVSPNPNCKTVFPRYKPLLPQDKNLESEHKTSTCVYDPDIINKSVVVQLRPLYNGPNEREEKGHEIEHFYELNDALD